MARQPFNKDEDAGKFASLPLISVLHKDDMKTARRLLQELEGLVAARKDMGEREEDIKNLLADMQEQNSLPGLRDQGRCFCVETIPGRKTLDKSLLVENGVTVEQIEASMKEGKPYDRKTFKVIPL
jgi:hypothetical protein